MMKSVKLALALLALGAAALLAGCERPPIQAVQHGYRGTGLDQIYNPRTVAVQTRANVVPESAPPASPDGPKASTIYKNVQVLGDLSIGEFARHMVAITSWVAPTEGCTYCHVGNNFADDSKYTKVVARRMVQMTQHINADWKNHVVGTGVTCYTCHRGKAVPSNIWFTPPPQVQASTARFLGSKAGQNTPAKSVTYASLPNDPFTPFLLQDQSIRVIGTEALPNGNRQSTKQAEWTYGLMVHMSDSLGVNCTYCHNSRSFGEWGTSAPQRATAWYGIRMVRDLNNQYLTPLTGVFPPNRLGAGGDGPKLNCATCHEGAYKPLYGQSMVGAHPELTVLKTAAVSEGTGDANGAVLFFAVGSVQLSDGAAKNLTALIETLKAKQSVKVAISGYSSAAGDLSANQELAKNRAMAVRDALVAAGVPGVRVKLEKPLSAEANLSGEDPKARRVEVTLI